MPPNNISETGPGAGHAPFQLLFDPTTASKREFLVRKHIRDSEPPSSLLFVCTKSNELRIRAPFCRDPSYSCPAQSLEVALTANLCYEHPKKWVSQPPVLILNSTKSHLLLHTCLCLDIFPP